MTSYIFSIFELNHIECILHTTALLNNLPGDLMDCGKLKPKHWLAHEHCQSLRLWRLGLSIICSDGLSWLYSALHIPTLQSNVLKSYKELHYQTCSKHNLPKTPKEPMDMSKTCVFGHREICLWKSMAYFFFVSRHLLSTVIRIWLFDHDGCRSGWLPQNQKVKRPTVNSQTLTFLSTTFWS
jgi:hypothetical protein